MPFENSPTGVEMTEDRRQIVESVKALCDQFDDHYWLDKDNKHEFPFEFHKAMADAGWLGLTMPEEYGGYGVPTNYSMMLVEEAAKLPATLMVQSALISLPLEKLMGPWAVNALPAGSIRAAWAC